MSGIQVNAQELDAIVTVIQTLLPLGIAAGKAIGRAIQAVKGTLSPEQFEALRADLEQRSAVREALAKADAGQQ